MGKIKEGERNSHKKSLRSMEEGKGSGDREERRVLTTDGTDGTDGEGRWRCLQDFRDNETPASVAR